MADDINITIGEDVINITTDSINSSTAGVSSDQKLVLDGSTAESYLLYNSTSERIELWVKGVLQKEFGALNPGGNPF